MGMTIGIVGGGAAGMMAAITAAELGAEVTLLEGNDRLGKKLLATGNGRCNLGNEKLELSQYYTGDPSVLETCLKRFGTEETTGFFRRIGLMIKSREGYLYPACGQASAVLDVLRYAVREAGVKVAADCRIEAVGRDSGKLWVKNRAGKILYFQRLILACGGRAAPGTGSDGSGYGMALGLGHSLAPVVPALVQLKCREDYFKAVAGVRADAELTVMYKGKCAARERGELQLTNFGLSGIPVFGLSRVANYILNENKHKSDKYLPEVLIDFLPDYSREAYERFCAERQPRTGRTVEEFFTGMLHKKLMMLFIKIAGLKPTEDIALAEAAKVRMVYGLCRQWSVHVTGSNSFEAAQVCAGGVPLSEVTENLESRKTPGVFFAGELLDVDGKCGGYNLQWAWCSGHIAGKAAAGGAGRPDKSKGNRG